MWRYFAPAAGLYAPALTGGVLLFGIYLIPWLLLLRSNNRYRDAGQCSGLQAGGEGPRWEGRQGPSSALTSRLLALLGHGDRHDGGDPAAVVGHVDGLCAYGDVVQGGGEVLAQLAGADLVRLSVTSRMVRLCTLFLVQLRYNFRVYPTPGQQIELARAFGCARVVFNDGLRLRQQAREQGLPYVSDAELSKRIITLAKQTPERAWLGEVSAVVLQQALAD